VHRFGLALAAALLAACPGTRPPDLARGAGACGGLDADACRRAEGLLAAASTYTNVRHDYVLDVSSSFVPGRGLARRDHGPWRALPTACATPKGTGTEQVDPAAASAQRGPGDGSLAAPGRAVDTTTIDFAFVGVAVDDVLVGADAQIAPFLGAGGEASEHTVRLVALAFVRDLDPQFFEASNDVTYAGDGCACGEATHFVGAVKMGGMLAFETTVRAREARGRALDFVKARLRASEASFRQTSVGSLEVDGLEAQLEGRAPRPVTFRVKNPVPIAYAAYPIHDVCKLAMPAPDVSPALVDFGDVAYGQEQTRLVHVVNRATIDLYAILREQSFAVPALGSLDIPISWRPEGETAGCESQLREETLVFVPRDPSAPVSPKQQTVRLVERVRTGKGAYRRAEPVDSGEARRPDYGKTARDWTCPQDYVVRECRAERRECSGSTRGCTQGEFRFDAQTSGNGCHFGCQGPSSLLGLSTSFCRFQAEMECQLRCPR
jgi:hypothetical protein